MLPAKRGLDPRKPADTNQAEISQRVGGSDTICTLFMCQRKTVLKAINPSESELNHGMFANDCYVEFPALAGDAMEALFVCHGGRKERRAVALLHTLSMEKDGKGSRLASERGWGEIRSIELLPKTGRGRVVQVSSILAAPLRGLLDGWIGLGLHGATDTSARRAIVRSWQDLKMESTCGRLVKLSSTPRCRGREEPCHANAKN
ncbi:hypothetical protein B0H19DRAFT_1065805 [Mycena capillaripes]|nr:hypothetical protein B0H19DRAFT_1065805 [Mycena capillaripes]